MRTKVLTGRKAPKTLLTTALALGVTALTPLVAARADTPAPIKLTCNESGEAALEVQFDGPRYADSLTLRSFDGDMVKALLARSEQSLRFTGSSISASLTVGKCVATPGRDTLLVCEATAAPRGTDFIFPTYKFHYYRNIGPGGDFNESVAVERGVKAESLKLTVSKRRVRDPLLGRDYTAAHVRLELAGQSPFGRFSLTEERTLGELVSEDRLSPWHTCAFTK